MNYHQALPWQAWPSHKGFAAALRPGALPASSPPSPVSDLRRGSKRQPRLSGASTQAGTFRTTADPWDGMLRGTRYLSLGNCMEPKG